MARILIAGCGYVGAELARRLRSAGHDVVGWRRRAAPGSGAVSVDVTDRVAVARALGHATGFELIVYAVGAERGDEASYRRAYLEGLVALRDGVAAAGRSPRWVCFTSSTSVYHQDSGEWVDEASPTQPDSFRGRILLEAERILREGFAATTALRLGGIYGPGRTRLAARVRDREPTLEPGPPRYTNRIHRDDAAGVLAQLAGWALAGREVPELLLGVDDEPATQRAVLTWLAEQLGVPLVERAPGAATGAASRRPGSKRCRNDRLRAAGYAFKYPNFRDGYRAVLGSDPAFRSSWRPIRP